MEYIALPTVYRPENNPNYKGAPFSVFAFDLIEEESGGCRYGTGRVYRVQDYNNGSIQLNEVEEGTRDYNRAMKWAGLESIVFKKGIRISQKRHHKILNVPEASANVTRDDVISMIRGRRVRNPGPKEEMPGGLLRKLFTATTGHSQKAEIQET